MDEVIGESVIDGLQKCSAPLRGGGGRDHGDHGDHLARPSKMTEPRNIHLAYTQGRSTTFDHVKAISLL